MFLVCFVVFRRSRLGFGASVLLLVVFDAAPEVAEAEPGPDSQEKEEPPPAQKRKRSAGDSALHARVAARLKELKENPDAPRRAASPAEPPAAPPAEPPDEPKKEGAEADPWDPTADWLYAHLYRVDMRNSNGRVSHQYYGSTNKPTERYQNQREGNAQAAAHVRLHKAQDPGGSRMVEKLRELPGALAKMGNQNGRIREMLLAAGGIADEADEAQGATVVRGGPWLRPDRRTWSSVEKEALEAVKRVLAHPYLAGATEPVGVGAVPGFPTGPTVTAATLCSSPQPWRDLGLLICRGVAKDAPGVSRFLCGYVTLGQSAAGTAATPPGFIKRKPQGSSGGSLARGP